MIYSLKYTEDVPNGHAGGSRFWMIWIKPAYKDDQGLFQHELEHVHQFWIITGLMTSLLGILGLVFYPLLLIALPLCLTVHNSLMTVCKPYLLWCEVRAYKKQLQFPPASTGDVLQFKRTYAGFLADPKMYGLNITVDKAFTLLD